MFARRKDQPPVVEEAVKDNLLPKLPDPVEQSILAEIAAAGQGLVAHREAKRAGDQEEQNLKSSIIDTERACELLADELPVKQRLVTKLESLRSKLANHNPERQNSEQLQAQIIQDISELKAAMQLAPADSKEAALLLGEITELETKQAEIIEASKDKIEEQLQSELAACQQKLIKYRVEKFLAIYKQRFLETLDKDLAEYKQGIDEEFLSPEMVNHLKQYFVDPIEYVSKVKTSLEEKVTLLITEFKTKIDSESIPLTQRITAKLDERDSEEITGIYVEQEVNQFAWRVKSELDVTLEAVFAACFDEINRDTGTIQLDRIINGIDSDLEDADKRYKSFTVDSPVKAAAENQIKYHKHRRKFYHSLLGPNLHRYRLLALHLEDYEDKLMALYFKSDAESYSVLLKLQDEIDNEKDEDARELLELKYLNCHMQLMIKEMSLAMMQISIMDLLNQTENSKETHLPFIKYNISYVAYRVLLQEFIALLEQVKDISAELAELAGEALLAKQQELARKQAQIMLLAMKIHYEYCQLPSDTPKVKNFEHRMAQYAETISDYEKYHQAQYCDPDKPRNEFEVNEGLMQQLYDLVNLLPESPVKSYTALIKGYEFAPSVAAVNTDDDWDFSDHNDDNDNEEDSTSSPRPPPPPVPYQEDEELAEDNDETRSQRSIPSLTL